MNCKPGDLAIVVRSKANAGRVVRCIKLLPAGTWLGVTSTTGAQSRAKEPVWLVEGKLRIFYQFTGEHFEVPYAYDSILRPLDADLNDETLEDTNERTIAA